MVNNLNLTQVVASIVAVAFGLASAVLFVILGLKGVLSAEFLGAIIGGVSLGAFHALGIVIGSVTSTTSSAQGAAQAMMVQSPVVTKVETTNTGT